MKIKHIYKSILLVAMTLLPLGCSKSSNDEPPVTRTGSVIVRVADDPNALANEMIHSWWVAFVSDKNGKVEKITQSGTLPADGVSQDIVDTEIAAGTYTVYGFANMTPEDLNAATGLKFEKGKQPQHNGSPVSHAQIMELTWNMAYAFGGTSTVQDWQKGALVPMTGFLQGVELNRTLNKDYALEVVRLVAKMEISFTSTSKQSVKVNGISMSPYTTEDINAFPTYSTLGGVPDFTQTENGTLTHPLAATITFFPGTEGVDEPKTEWFYLRECVARTQSDENVTEAPDAANLFRFTLNVAKGTDAAKEVNFVVDGFGHVNRNDFIRIPVNFSDVSDLDVKIIPTFYPPIGGYPAMNFTESRENAVTTITFGTQGYFEFDPVLLLMSGEVTSSDMVRIESFKIISSPAGFMSLYFSDDDVVGQINDITGEARVEFTILARENTSAAFNEYKRTVIIKR